MKHSTSFFSTLLNCLLLTTILLVLICNFAIGRQSMTVQEKQLNLLLESEKDKINFDLEDISDSVDMLAKEVLSSLDDYTELSKPLYEESFSDSMKFLLQSILEEKASGYTIYLRYNPELSPGKTGLFLQKRFDGRIADLEPTDILAYDPADEQRVGWYYIPSNYGSALWLNPYYNYNVDTYMISYVNPLFVDGYLVGVIGMDINMTSLLKEIDRIRFFSNGHAVLKDRYGKQLSGFNVNSITNSIHKDVQLDNAMTLSAVISEKELYSIRYGIVYNFIMIFMLFLLFVVIAVNIIHFVLQRKSIKSDKIDIRFLILNIGLFFLLGIVIVVTTVFTVSWIRDDKPDTGSEITANNHYSDTIYVVADYDFEPYSFMDSDGNFRGYDVELINAIANRIGVNVIIHLTTWNDATTQIATGAADVILGLEWNDNRPVAGMVKSDITCKDQFVFYGTKPINSINDFYKARIANIKGATNLDILNLGSQMVLFDSYTDAFAAVNDGLCDYVLSRQSIASSIISELKLSDFKEIYSLKSSVLCFGVNPRNLDLLERMNDAISSLRVDNTISQIESRWFSRNAGSTLLGVIKTYSSFYYIMLIFLVILLIEISYVHIFHRNKIQMKSDQLEKERLKKISNTDVLTGLLNRRRYDEILNELGHRADNRNLLLISLDLNGLKVANDTIGHQAGDELICGISDCILKSFGQYGECFRTGGDEFFVICPNGIPSAEEKIEDFRKIVSEWHGKTIDSMSVALGFIRAKDYPDATISDLLHIVDMEMYSDKSAYYRSSGKDRRMR